MTRLFSASQLVSCRAIPDTSKAVWGGCFTAGKKSRSIFLGRLFFAYFFSVPSTKNGQVNFE